MCQQGHNRGSESDNPRIPSSVPGSSGTLHGRCSGETCPVRRNGIRIGNRPLEFIRRTQVNRAPTYGVMIPGNPDSGGDCLSQCNASAGRFAGTFLARSTYTAVGTQAQSSSVEKPLRSAHNPCYEVNVLLKKVLLTAAFLLAATALISAAAGLLAGVPWMVAVAGLLLVGILLLVLLWLAWKATRAFLGVSAAASPSPTFSLAPCPFRWCCCWPA